MKDVHIPYIQDTKYAEYAPLMALVWSAHTVIFPLRLGITMGLTRIIAKRLGY